MRRSLCLALLLLICASAFPAKCLMIELSGGSKIYYSFEKYVPLIRFDNGVMRVSTRKIEFGRIVQFAVIDDPSGIEAVEAAPQFSADGYQFTITSLEPIRVFNLAGVPCQVTVTVSDEAQHVNLTQLPTGTYVVQCAEQSFTIYKK